VTVEPVRGGSTGGSRVAMRAGRGLAVALAIFIELALLTLIGCLVLLVLVSSGLLRLIWAAVAVLVLWQLVPRPSRVDERAVRVSGDEAPGLHGVVQQIADRLQVRAPDAIFVDTIAMTTAMLVGYRRRRALIVSLPQWTALDPSERVAAVSLELAFFSATRTPAHRLVAAADAVLGSLLALMTPARTAPALDTVTSHALGDLGAGGTGSSLAATQAGRGAATAVGSAGVVALSAPVRGLRSLLRRNWAPTEARVSQYADAQAVRIVGPDAVTSFLASTLHVPRGRVAAQVAARNRRDPFQAIAASTRPAPQEVLRRLDDAELSQERVDLHHPPTAQRVHHIRRASIASPLAPIDRALAASADRDIDPFRARLSGRYAEELIHGRS
jgi:hypothetical protein